MKELSKKGFWNLMIKLIALHVLFLILLNISYHNYLLILYLVTIPLILVVGFYNKFCRFILKKKLLKNGVKTKATIKSTIDKGMYNEHTGIWNHIFYLEVLAKDKDGRSFSTTIKALTKKHNFNRGTQIPIVYNPKKPQQAILDPNFYIHNVKTTKEKKEEDSVLNQSYGD